MLLVELNEDGLNSQNARHYQCKHMHELSPGNIQHSEHFFRGISNIRVILFSVIPYYFISIQLSKY